MVGCQTDPNNPGGGTGGGGTGGGGTDNLAPKLTITSESSLTVDAASAFKITLSAQKGESPMKSLTVYQGAEKIATSRLQYDGKDAAANPRLLFNEEKTSLTTELTIIAHETVGDETYKVEITDDAGKKAEKTVVVTTLGDPPSVKYIGSATIVSKPSKKRLINIEAEAGSTTLSKVSILENGKHLPETRLVAGGTATASPFGIGNQSTSFNKESLPISIITPATVGTYDYEVIVENAAGKTASTTFKIKVEPEGTAINQLDDYIVLLNSSGPAGTGGLDLDIADPAKASVGSRDVNAEVRDLGIDDSKPKATDWRKIIAPANDAEMKYIKPGQNGTPEGFKFDDLVFTEQLPGLWETGVALQNGVSNVVQAGDMFIVQRSGKLYALNVIEVRENTSTGADKNDDKYVFDLKRQ